VHVSFEKFSTDIADLGMEAAEKSNMENTGKIHSLKKMKKMLPKY
jgi:hypothetical protein